MNTEKLECKAELWLRLRGLKEFSRTMLVCNKCRFKEECWDIIYDESTFKHIYKNKCIRWLDNVDEV